MPIYEYQCSECGQKKEALQKLSDAPLKDCPACGKPTLTKLISAAGFQLKGSGWYVTDFRGGKSTKPETEKSSAKASGDSKAGGDRNSNSSDKSGESKPAEAQSTESAKPAAAAGGTTTTADSKAS
jgi:putative FmdB family regulatory protein